MAARRRPSVSPATCANRASNADRGDHRSRTVAEGVAIAAVAGRAHRPPVNVKLGEANRATRHSYQPARRGAGSIPRATAASSAERRRATSPTRVTHTSRRILVRQYGLRKSDEIAGTTGRDPRGRTALIEITTINGAPAADAVRRPEFNTLIATYPERKLYARDGSSGQERAPS